MADRSAEGHYGELRAGYQLAATLSGWTLRPLSRGVFEIQGSLQVVSSHWLEEGPLALVLEVPGKSWRWEGARLSRAADRVTVRVQGRPRE